MNPLHLLVEKALTVRPPERVVQLVQLVWPPRATEQAESGFVFSQLHIDVARNATGDFNPFHDPARWHRVRGNPFGGPIAMGFQLEMLLLEAVQRQRAGESRSGGVDTSGFRYARSSFTFADVVRAGEAVAMDIRPSRWRVEEDSVSNRVSLRRDGRAVLMGRLEAGNGDSLKPRCTTPLPAGPDSLADGIRFREGRCFLKKKTLQVSDAKNFLAGSLVPHHPYFDELEGRARFPELFPVALVSSVLLEKAALEGYDFLADPMVYTAHSFSVDRCLLGSLASGDTLFILVDGPRQERAGTGGMVQSRYCCAGLLPGGAILFQMETRLASLRELRGIRRARNS